MAYIKTQWQDHVTQYTNRYDQTENADGSINLSKVQGEVVQQGTPMSAENFNNLEDGVEAAHVGLEDHIEDTNAHMTEEERESISTAVSNITSHIGNNGIHLTTDQKTDLTDGEDSSGHYHSVDRNRENHTGEQTSSTISDFAATVRTTVLNGLSFIADTAITAADTVISALGKLQKQIIDHSADTTMHITTDERTAWNGNVIDIAALKAVKTAIIPTTGWSSTAPYSVSVTVSGLTDSRPDINPIYSATLETALLEKEAWNTISYIDCTTDTMTVTCLEEIPTIEINIELVGG